MNFDNLILKERMLDTICLILGRSAKALGRTKFSPYFIIGTGRCGTSLLVKVLDSHPRLCGFPGEANELWHPRLEPFEMASIDIPPIEIDPQRFSEISIESWPPKHGDTIRNIFMGFQLLTGPSRVFFSKSAMVSFMIRKILDIFPNAKFIHIYRYGPSVIESYFKKNFGKYSHYKYTDKDYRRYCAKYWNDCIMEIEDSKIKLSLEGKGQFFEFSYESFCEDPKNLLDRLAGFLHVPSEGFCFDTSKIASQNYKALDFTDDPDGKELLELMLPGLRLKGYLTQVDLMPD